MSDGNQGKVLDCAKPIGKGVVGPSGNTTDVPATGPSLSSAPSSAKLPHQKQYSKPDWAKPIANGLVGPSGDTTGVPDPNPISLSAPQSATPIDKKLEWAIPIAKGTVHPLGYTTDIPLIEPATKPVKSLSFFDGSRTISIPTPKGTVTFGLKNDGAEAPPSVPRPPSNTLSKQRIGVVDLPKIGIPLSQSFPPQNTLSKFRTRTIHFSDKMEVISSKASEPGPDHDSSSPFPLPIPDPAFSLPPPAHILELVRSIEVPTHIATQIPSHPTTPPPPSLPPHTSSKQVSRELPTPSILSPAPNTPLKKLSEGPSKPAPSPPSPTPPEPSFPPPSVWPARPRNKVSREPATPSPPSSPPKVPNMTLSRGTRPPPPNPSLNTPSKPERVQPWTHNSQVSLSLRGRTGPRADDADAGPTISASTLPNSDHWAKIAEEIEGIICALTASYRQSEADGEVMAAWQRGQETTTLRQHDANGQELPMPVISFHVAQRPQCIFSLSEIKAEDVLRWSNSLKLMNKRVEGSDSPYSTFSLPTDGEEKTLGTVIYLSDGGGEIEIPMILPARSAHGRSQNPPWFKTSLTRYVPGQKHLGKETANQQHGADGLKVDAEDSMEYCFRILRPKGDEVDRYFATGKGRYIKMVELLADMSAEELWTLKCLLVTTSILRVHLTSAGRLVLFEEMFVVVLVGRLKESLGDVADLIMLWMGKPLTKEKSFKIFKRGMAAMSRDIADNMEDGRAEAKMSKDLDPRIACIEAGDMFAVFTTPDPEVQRSSQPVTNSNASKEATEEGEATQTGNLQDLQERAHNMNFCLSVFNPATQYPETNFQLALNMLANVSTQETATFICRIRSNLGGEAGPQANATHPESPPQASPDADKLRQIAERITQSYLELTTVDEDAGLGVRPAEEVEDWVGLTGGVGLDDSEDDEDDDVEKDSADAQKKAYAGPCSTPIDNAELILRGGAGSPSTGEAKAKVNAQPRSSSDTGKGKDDEDAQTKAEDITFCICELWPF